MLERLWDETCLVRGGVMELRYLRESIQDAMSDPSEGFPNLCFWGENGYSVEQVCEEAGLGHLPQGNIKVSTVGALRALDPGSDLYRSEPWPHLTLRFGYEPTDDELEAVRAVFGDPIPNPLRGG